MSGILAERRQRLEALISEFGELLEGHLGALGPTERLAIGDAQHAVARLHATYVGPEARFGDQPEKLTLCAGCGCEIDPDTCYCGMGKHSDYEGHPFVPMGCDCYRRAAEEEARVWAESR